MGNTCSTGTMISKFKDFLDDPFGFLIHHNSIFDFRMLLVAQRCVSTDTLTGSVLCTKRSLYFTAGVLGKPFIEQIFERNEITETFFGILIFCNSDITDILLWEHKFQIVVHHNVFTTKTGKVFCDDAVDPSRIHIVYHSLKCWSVKIRTRPSIVNILVHHMKLVVTGKLL